MAFDGTGMIYIPLEDFWVFASALIPLDDPFSLRNPQVRGEVLQIDIVNENSPQEVIETKEIDMAEFWAFANDWHPFATGKAPTEFCFGVPKIIDYDLVIEYAVSTMCHPLDWAAPPKFMKEWDESPHK